MALAGAAACLGFHSPGPGRLSRGAAAGGGGEPRRSVAMRAESRMAGAGPPGPLSARLGGVRARVATKRGPWVARGDVVASVTRAVDFMPNDNTDVVLDTVAEELLFQALHDDDFLGMVRDQWCSTKGVDECPAEIEPMGPAMLFVPVPWSRETRHGMPQEFERYHNHPDYCIINIPPNFLMAANIFKPSKLAAVFRRVGAGEPPPDDGPAHN